jgi:hypothetical protein
LTEHFIRQLDALREVDFEACPGEDECEQTGPIFIERIRMPDLPAETICERCPLYPTKPGREPRHLVGAIRTATELDADKAICGSFNYPAVLHELTAFEWTCIAALIAARSESEAQALRNRKKAVDHSVKRNDLETMRRR